jgi:hypothetical protein
VQSPKRQYHLTTSPGANFSYIFFCGKLLAAENYFLRKILWNFLEKNDFSKLFPQKIPFFTNIFGGKIFRGNFPEIFPEIFPGKNVRKISPMATKGASTKSKFLSFH